MAKNIKFLKKFRKSYFLLKINKMNIYLDKLNLNLL
jgi:hypothetical protein